MRRRNQNFRMIINNFNNWQKVTRRDVEDMLYQIQVCSDRFEAKRFNKLNFDRQRKVTFLLKERQKLIHRAGMTLEKTIIREIIDDAARDQYVFDVVR